MNFRVIAGPSGFGTLVIMGSPLGSTPAKAVPARARRVAALTILTDKEERLGCLLVWMSYTLDRYLKKRMSAVSKERDYRRAVGRLYIFPFASEEHIGA